MSLTAVDFTLSPMLESGTSVNVQDVQDIEEKVYTILESKCQTLHDLNDPNGFIPYSDLKSIFTAEVIRHILRQNGKLQLLEHDLEEIVSCILAEDTSKVMIKIFAILVLTGMVKYIREFICNGLTDADLPMTQKPTLDERLSFWKKRKFDAFSSRQWLVDVPVLDFEIDDLETIEEYPDETRMPFLHRIPVGKGGQGKVEKVTVHPSHVVNSSDTIFAMKRMDSLLKWEDETKALNRFRDKSGHDHIIKLLLAFKYRGKGYLLFPLAEGDLDHYWKLNTSQSFSAEEVHWLIEQCTGIASALRKIHNHLSFHGERRGRHGDIKPGNILWFSNLAEGHGRLVLADLTMTRFHSDGTVEDTTIKNRAMTMTYRPPEADVNVKTKASQAFDVWSLGCVFLEYIVWYIMGYDAARHDSDEYLDSQQRVRQNFNRARVNEDGADPGSFSFDKFFKAN
ncbi:kinase-like domain-containing protein [Nemania sp. FL0916]|nr:kinase-like domain-containing protein [Nemania sp. FL0916]